MIKLQDFATHQGVTDRQIQRLLKKYADELEGLYQRKGPNGTWLTEEACEILRGKMKQAPITVINESEQVSFLQQENKKLLEALNLAKDKIILLQEQNTQISLENARIALLEADIGEKDKILEETRKTVQKAQDELTETRKQFEDEVYLLKQELEAEKNRKLTLKERLFGKK